MPSAPVPRATSPVAAGDVESLTTGTATPTEQTPLISGTSSATSAHDSSISSRSRRASATTDSSPTSNGPRIGPWRATAVALSLWQLIFLQASNMSGMTMIQGKLADDLQAYEAAMWFTSAYLIPMSSLAPVAGRLATIFPPRSLVFPVSVLIAIGGLVCSQATTFAAFIAGRAITGFGGAGVLTLSVILVLELTNEESRGLYVGLVNAGLTFGVSFGAVVYGTLLPITGWRPLFWIQAPFALVAGLGVYLSIPTKHPDSKDDNKGSVKEKLLRIDYLGASLLTATIILFLYGLSGDIQALPILVSAATLLLFLVVEYRVAADPIIPLKILSSRSVLLSCLAQLGLMSARWSVLFYGPIFMLAVCGASPAAAGSVLIPTNIGFAFGGVIVGWLHVRRGGAFWLPSVITVAVFSASLYTLSLVGTATPSTAALVAVVVVNGLAVGAGLNYTLAHILHLSHDDTQYISTSLLATFRGFGGSFGTAIGGGIFYRLLRSDLTAGFLALDGGDQLSLERRRLVSRLLGTPGLVHDGSLSADEQAVAVSGYAVAISGVWKAAAILGVVTVGIQAATGWSAPVKQDDEEMMVDEERAREV